MLLFIFGRLYRYIIICFSCAAVYLTFISSQLYSLLPPDYPHCYLAGVTGSQFWNPNCLGIHETSSIKSSPHSLHITLPTHSPAMQFLALLLSSSPPLLLQQLEPLPLLWRLPLPTTHPLCILRLVMDTTSHQLGTTTTTMDMSSQGMSSPGTTTSTTGTMGTKHTRDTTTTMGTTVHTTTMWSSRTTKWQQIKKRIKTQCLSSANP